MSGSMETPEKMERALAWARENQHVGHLHEDIARCYLALHARVAEQDKWRASAEQLSEQYHSILRLWSDTDARATTAEATLAKANEMMERQAKEVVAEMEAMTEIAEESKQLKATLARYREAAQKAGADLLAIANRAIALPGDEMCWELQIKADVRTVQEALAALLPSPAATTEDGRGN